MLVTILICIIVVMSVLTALVTGALLRRHEDVRDLEFAKAYWMKQYFDKDVEYSALEQGRDEESDSYEQQFLTFTETIDGQSKAIDSYIEDLHFLVGFAEELMDPTINGVTAPDYNRWKGIKDNVVLIVEDDPKSV